MTKFERSCISGVIDPLAITKQNKFKLTLHETLSQAATIPIVQTRNQHNPSNRKRTTRSFSLLPSKSDA